jgi:hypothetical protein
MPTPNSNAKNKVPSFRKGSDKASKLAEKRLQELMDQNKVNPNNIDKIRKRIANKYGVYPMGKGR